MTAPMTPTPRTICMFMFLGFSNLSALPDMEEKSSSKDRGRRGGGEDRRSHGGREKSNRRQEKGGEESEDQRTRRPSKNPARDHHKRHLEKLMEHPDRPVPIPEPSKDRKPAEPPEFVRFYMGSSAGAGSEVFHVYRHLRRRENDRQDYISTKAKEEVLEEEFQQTMAMHRAEDNARTAKKRAKRLKRKQRQKLAKKLAKTEGEGGKGAEVKPVEESSGGEGEEEEVAEQHFIIGGN